MSRHGSRPRNKEADGVERRDVALEDWFLLASERDNDATELDRRHPGRAWTAGNEVHALVHGAEYFEALADAIGKMRSGDHLLFTDWRGDPDQRLDRRGTEVGQLMSEAAQRGVLVRGLVWRSHLDRFRFSARENRHLGEEINSAGGICLLDMRVRPGGSHHQKFVVLRHPQRAWMDCAFVGGIDLGHSRRDDRRHAGDVQAQPMAKVYGPRPPWHDIQLQLRGPSVGDVDTVFRERWNDPSPLSRNPIHRLRDKLGNISDWRPLPAQLDDPSRRGTQAVQLLRTYPPRVQALPFAPDGERSAARGIIKALARARHLVYLEDQFLWSREVIANYCRRLETEDRLLLVAVVSSYPDQDGRFSKTPNLIGRAQAIESLKRAGGRRVAIYGLENHEGIPIYVHAKVCIVDDEWAKVGSDNINRRSWTYDSELSCAIVDEAPNPSLESAGESFARDLRLRLAREHLDRASGDDEDLVQARSFFDAFAATAARLETWHAAGRSGPRPPGRLRLIQAPQLGTWTRFWATPLYRVVYDPDGRSRSSRKANRY
jgi:phosphatidylserine/phosphatidylglycerophosphate/cardiolipin synthase-like enzyme